MELIDVDELDYLILTPRGRSLNIRFMILHMIRNLYCEYNIIYLNIYIYIYIFFPQKFQLIISQNII